MTRFFRQARTIAGKDLRSELRNKEAINAALAFSVVVLLLFSLAFDPIANPQTRDLAGGLLWIVYLFAGILLLNRSFAREIPNDCLEALIAAPIPGSAIFVGKAFANSVLLLMVELISLPIFGMFYDINWFRGFDLLLPVFVLGTWAFAVIGTTFSAITANNRLRELMLPLLVFPIAVPALMACVQLTTVILMGEPLGESLIWIKLLIGFNVIFTLLGSVLLETVLVG